MKKFFKAASIFAAVSMLFAFASCQQNPEEPSTSGTAPVFKVATYPVDLSLISGVASVTEVSSDNEKVATATNDGAKVTVKSVAKGTAKITAKVTGADSKTGTVEISVTVAETGTITVSETSPVKWDEPETPTDPENPGEDPVVPPTEPANPFAGKTFYGALEVSEGMVFDVVKLEFGDTTVKMTLYATVAGKEDTVETLNYTVADNKATITYAGKDITTTAIEKDTFQATLDDDTPTFTTKEGTRVPVEPVDPPAATGFVVDITASGELHDALNAIALKGSLAEGTYDGITLAGNSIIRANDKSKIVLETKGTISFSVTKGQKITLKLGSTSSSNTSAIQLSGAVTTDVVPVVGTSYDPLEYTADETGTVTINACADSATYNRGTRVIYIAVE